MIKIEHLYVELGDFELNDVNLDIDEGEYFVVLGPTGAGKTVLLESIAGLNYIKSGVIWVKDSDITSMKPEKRGISIVYQDHSLFPHLTVKDNILFGLRLRKKSASELLAAQEWLGDLLNISHLFKRKPLTLSGGERQKVALARALSTRPDVLLLDEPLSALDPDTRESIQQELRKLHRVLNNTVVHVTHDFEEAMALGSRIAVIGEGQVKQVGEPEEIFRRPQSLFLANFTMTRNIFYGEVIRDTAGKTVLKTKNNELNVETDIEGQCCASIRPEDVLLSTQPYTAGTPNVFSGTVTEIIDKGFLVNVNIAIPRNITCLITRNQFLEMRLKKDSTAYVMFRPSSVHIFKDKNVSLDS